jgi:hypothetical protein
MRQQMGTDSRVFLSLWTEEMLVRNPIHTTFIAIRPNRFPIWQSVVAGAGAQNTGFNAVVSVGCFKMIASDTEMRNERTISDETLSITAWVMKAISAAQFWEPQDLDGNDLLREYARVQDGGFAYRTINGKGGPFSVSSFDVEMKLSALLPTTVPGPGS